MGQYYYVVNVDKKEFLYPHKFGDGLKLMEFGSSGCGTMTGLAILLADGNGRGGGDIRSEDEIIGSWAGDRIVIAGDYADTGRFIKKKDCEDLKDEATKTAIFVGLPLNYKKVNLHDVARASFKDISLAVLLAMMDDKYLADELSKDSFGNKNLVKTWFSSRRPRQNITSPSWRN